jgi:hypothetical protein
MKVASRFLTYFNFSASARQNRCKLQLSARLKQQFWRKFKRQNLRWHSHYVTNVATAKVKGDLPHTLRRSW